MTQVKGTSLIYIKDFVTKNYGQESTRKWIEALSPEAKSAYSKIIFPQDLLEMDTYYTKPLQMISEMFCNGDISFAIELGKFSAEAALNSIYKFFLKFGSPLYICKKAGQVWSTFFIPCMVEFGETRDKHVEFRITKLDGMNKIIENVMLGANQRGMELSGAKNLKLTIEKSMLKGDPYTEFVVEWD